MLELPTHLYALIFKYTFSEASSATFFPQDGVVFEYSIISTFLYFKLPLKYKHYTLSTSFLFWSYMMKFTFICGAWTWVAIKHKEGLLGKYFSARC